MSLFADYEPRPPQGPGRPSSFSIRRAVPADLPDIVRILHERDGGSRKDHARRLRSQIEDSERRHPIVAVVDDRVAAYGRSAYFVPPEGSPADTAPEGWYLVGVVVDPEHRRRGIGLALTERRLAWLRERTDHAYYFANAENRATIDLHGKLGFVEVTREFSFPGVSFSGAGVGILFRVGLGDGSRPRHLV